MTYHTTIQGVLFTPKLLLTIELNGVTIGKIAFAPFELPPGTIPDGDHTSNERLT